jgi:hypothetical protein
MSRGHKTDFMGYVENM